MCIHFTYNTVLPVIWEVWVHKTSLTPPPFIEVSVPRESERSCICVLGVSILPLSTILIFGFGIVPTLRYFWFFTLLPELLISGIRLSHFKKTF